MNYPIEAIGLMKHYGKQTGLNQVTVNIAGEKIIGLIGRNGAGKTSFLRICAGLLRPNAGEIRVWGEQPFDNLRVLSRLIFIGEETHYGNQLKLKEVMNLGAIYFPNWDQAFADKVMKRFQLDPAARYKHLSLGTKTQFKVLMGLASRVPLVLFDEPTLGMDAAVRKEFYNILVSDYSERPRTIVISTHLPDEVENLVEEVLLLKDGKVVLQKSIEEMQQYAIRLHGKKDDIDLGIQGKPVLYRENFANNSSVVIQSKSDPKELDWLEALNLHIRKVTFQDLCIYLTEREKVRVYDETAI
jgi:ABC-2 type transport system ATP-binding protein